MLLAGKVALVSGAASGIGLAVAEAYAREGAAVVLSDIDADAGQAAAARLAGGGAKVRFVQADVAQPGDHEKVVAIAEEQFGALHVACNNAGITGGRQPLTDLPVERWREVIEVNLSGVFYAMRAQLPAMERAGGGAIVNMASVMGQVAMEGISAYVASKHGVVGLTRAAALENAAKNIRINAVGPGYISTPLLENLPPPARAFLVSQHPMGRLGEAAEVAELVVWLSSGKAGFATGAYYTLDGGYLAR